MLWRVFPLVLIRRCGLCWMRLSLTRMACMAGVKTPGVPLFRRRAGRAPWSGRALQSLQHKARCSTLSRVERGLDVERGMHR